MTERALEVYGRVDGDAATVRVTGAWTVWRAAEARDALRAAVEDAAQIEVDLSEVDEADITALQLLASLQRTASVRGGALRLVAPSDAVRTSAEALGLADWLRAAAGAGVGEPVARQGGTAR